MAATHSGVVGVIPGTNPFGTGAPDIQRPLDMDELDGVASEFCWGSGLSLNRYEVRRRLRAGDIRALRRTASESWASDVLIGIIRDSLDAGSPLADRTPCVLRQ
jgi:hypothetical protein